MKHTLPGPLSDHARNIMRQLGYGELQKRDGQISYVKRVSGGDFPRYHAYVENLEDGGMQVNLHVDQKAASYEGSHAHSGEYEGTLVEGEMRRIVAFSQPTGSATAQPQPPVSEQKKKTGYLSKFFSP